MFQLREQLGEQLREINQMEREMCQSSNSSSAGSIKPIEPPSHPQIPITSTPDAPATPLMNFNGALPEEPIALFDEEFN
ncbi:hypothetical protein AZE42_12201 [Rhizopogon vesiculosus]|uniref:Uncharacterized protein n=1 Tax=Rhizopogon vesiculosus TaxID=180088 RepID=A0A1J8QP42_9AGAM|nr:hypothetical protein AZE42_12201 [Rhizopogon vesiculosus]